MLLHIQNHKKTVKPCHSPPPDAYRPLTRHPHLLNTTTARMLFLPSHCVTCVRKTRWRIIILCLLYNFNTKCRCINISAFSSNCPINRRTNQNLPCWRFALWRYSSTRLSSVLLSWDIFAAENKRTTRPFFSERIHQLTISPATRWVRNNKGELQLSILYSTSISLKLYSSAYVVSQWILTYVYSSQF